MIKNIAFQKVVYILLAVSILLAAVVVIIPTSSNSVVLAETSVNFDSTNVMDDLSSCVIDGEAFDINDYPKDPYGTLQVLTFVEYCYSFYENNNGNYGLYIYLYNPALTKFEASHVLNKIQMAVSFNDMDYADDYQKFSLKLCSKSSDGLFYKYKVVDTQNILLSMVQEFSKTHAGLRQYYVSGIELVKRGESNATEYNVAMNYQYSGFAEGYGDSENFPLSMTSAGIETLQTDVHYTWWRPEGETEGGNNIQSQLNSVYFSVPNELLKKYGVLQAVSMEWYEYVTKPIFVTANSTVYNHLINYVGDTFISYSEDAKYGFAVNKVEAGPNDQYPLADYAYNAPGIYLNPKSDGYFIYTLYYLFKSSKSNAKDYTLPAEDILKYIQNYKGSGEKINGKYYSELFEDYVDEGRQIGYNQVDVKAEDEFSLTSYNLSQSFWQKPFGIADYEKEEFNNIKGIEKIDSADFTLSDDSFSSKYFVNSEDASDIKKYCVSSQLEDRSVFILRYAVTSYESKTATEVQGTKSLGVWFSEELDSNAYMMQETVFLDLDLIDVTFYKDGVSTVIPVVSSPIDGIADGTPPVEDPDNWLSYLIGIILGIIVLILILYVAGPILPYILKGIVWIITLPFRAIKAIIKALKKRN